jgi:hypothetical protein
MIAHNLSQGRAGGLVGITRRGFQRAPLELTAGREMNQNAGSY